MRNLAPSLRTTLVVVEVKGVPMNALISSSDKWEVSGGSSLLIARPVRVSRVFALKLSGGNWKDDMK